MEPFQIFFDSRIPQLEKDNQWKQAVDLVLMQWADCPDDLNRLLCAGTQLWYSLLIMDDVQSNPSPPSRFEFISVIQLQKDLMRITRYGFNHFADNPIFNAYFGYMISVMPHYFDDYNGDYVHWKAKGISMMRYSYELDPNSPFTKAMYYEPVGFGKGTLFYDSCKEIWLRVTPEQWGNSEVSQYFFRILHGDSFYKNAYPDE